VAVDPTVEGIQLGPDGSNLGLGLVVFGLQLFDCVLQFGQAAYGLVHVWEDVHVVPV
jgi:hypothetical protein